MISLSELLTSLPPPPSGRTPATSRIDPDGHKHPEDGFDAHKAEASYKSALVQLRLDNPSITSLNPNNVTPARVLLEIRGSIVKERELDGPAGVKTVQGIIEGGFVKFLCKALIDYHRSPGRDHSVGGYEQYVSEDSIRSTLHTSVVVLFIINAFKHWCKLVGERLVSFAYRFRGCRLLPQSL